MWVISTVNIYRKRLDHALYYVSSPVGKSVGLSSVVRSAKASSGCGGIGIGFQELTVPCILLSAVDPGRPSNL